MTPAEREKRTGADEDVHVLMPSMAYACGGNILTTKGRSVFSAATDWENVTCTECRQLGQAALWRTERRMQGHDADACECSACRHGRKALDAEAVDLLDLL